MYEGGLNINETFFFKYSICYTQKQVHVNFLHNLFWKCSFPSVIIVHKVFYFSVVSDTFNQVSSFHRLVMFLNNFLRFLIDNLFWVVTRAGCPVLFPETSVLPLLSKFFIIPLIVDFVALRPEAILSKESSS